MKLFSRPSRDVYAECSETRFIRPRNHTIAIPPPSLNLAQWPEMILGSRRLSRSFSSIGLLTEPSLNRVAEGYLGTSTTLKIISVHLFLCADLFIRKHAFFFFFLARTRACGIANIVSMNNSTSLFLMS